MPKKKEPVHTPGLTIQQGNFLRQNRAQLHKLSRQEQRFLFFYLQGWDAGKAAVAVGMQAKAGPALLHKEYIADVLDDLAMAELQEVFVNRDFLNRLTLEAHASSITASEQLKAIDMLAKLNGIYETAKPVFQTQVVADQGPSQRLKSFTDEELANAAGMDADLDPS